MGEDEPGPARRASIAVYREPHLALEFKFLAQNTDEIGTTLRELDMECANAGAGIQRGNLHGRVIATEAEILTAQPCGRPTSRSHRMRIPIESDPAVRSELASRMAAVITSGASRCTK